MLIDGIKAELSKIDCENAKTAISKYGVSIICDEQIEKEPDIKMPTSENCENLKRTISKYGISVVCED